MKKGQNFNPTEIIFSATTLCNLHCNHCFVSRQDKKIQIEAAKKFIQSCKNTSIEKIGFTGGEPFLYFDFILEITKVALENDFLFDQIMTNGDWWKSEEELTEKLQTLYDAGYDGHIGLSWDNFHGQNKERMITFIKKVQSIFGNDSINIQYVDDNGKGISLEEIKSTCPEISVFQLPQTFPSNDSRAWKSKKWFKEDFCTGPGNVLYVHTNGNIAPCCGFANENSKLFIGNINNTFEEIMGNASKNEMIQLCFTKGLSSKIKEVKKYLKQKKSPLAKCKTDDICSFCDFICKNQLN